MIDYVPTMASITGLGKNAFLEAAWEIVGGRLHKAGLFAGFNRTVRSSTGTLLIETMSLPSISG